jgi:hypothetical protein
MSSTANGANNMTRLEKAAKAMLDAFGGNFPDWLCDEAQELEASLAEGALVRETLDGMREVFEVDCGVHPCVGSMAPAEHLCGVSRRLLGMAQS